MTSPSKRFVSVMRNGRGWFPVVVDMAGPMQSSPIAHATREAALADARAWAQAEGLAVSCEETRPETLPACASTRHAAKYYAGIGSRETPTDILALMQELAACLARSGWTLRSGAATGADSAFEAGALAAQGAIEIYLPWAGFGQRRADGLRYCVAESLPAWPRAVQIAAAAHPRWPHLKPSARRLHGRNVFQLLGHHVDTPCRFVLCWARSSTLDPAGHVVNVAGGTGQAVRIAAGLGVEVVNLALDAHRARCCRWLEAVGAGDDDAL